MKSKILIDFSELGNEPVISIKSISSSDDLRDKALVRFLSPIENKIRRHKETYLHITHKSSFGSIGSVSESGNTWEITSFNRDMSLLNEISGMYKLLCFESDNNHTMCNTGTHLYFENLGNGKKSANISIDDLENIEYHALAETISKNFKSILDIPAQR